MSPEERSFLLQMDEVWRVEDAWMTTGMFRVTIGGNPVDVRMTPSIWIPTLERMLKDAGHTLGLNVRFCVVMTVRPRSVSFMPKNGAAGRMLQRYQDLYTERELTSECGA